LSDVVEVPLVAVFSFSGAEVVLVVVSCSSRGGRGSWQQGCWFTAGESIKFSSKFTTAFRKL
jgi:hypothetical protein